MQVFENFLTLNKSLKSIASKHFTLGFVPTMGALHKGHLSLIDSALEQNDWVVVSIFVNPTQFNNPNDFATYPRTVEKDLQLLKDYQDNVLVYLPEVKEIYPSEISTKTIDFGGLEHQMEGAFRPGHFEGVATVLNSFFRLIKPTKAYFGEKDFQQLQIVKKLVEIEKMDITIVGCPILREPSGLAMSSRNVKLNENQRNEAPNIYRVLRHVKNIFGTKSVKEISAWVEASFKDIKELELEYFQIADENTLKPTQTIEKSKHYRAFIAVFAGDVRLIDNIALN